MRKVGDFSVAVLNGGNFRIDGGAMHGVVPKTIWSKLVSCDELNRVEYSTHCLLLEGRGRRILIESGNGDKFPAKERDIYGIDHDESIEKSLKKIGVEPESIDLVLMTHLHFDHSGGTTKWKQEVPVPIFPRARHVIQKGEYFDATHPHERNRASYLEENFVPLAEQNLLWLVEGDQEIVPGVRVLRTPGHTAHHQSVLIETGSETLLFLGDVVPTSVHVRLPFIMGYDLDVVTSLNTKKSLFARAIEERWIVLWGHDLEHHGGRLRPGAKGPEVAEYVEF